MMNGSNGFQSNSALGSSTGFKKRPLLRPASGMLNKRLEFLRSVDISQSEPVIATSLRSEVASIEEEISLLDKDKRIRQGESGLQKGYVGALRKWLRETQGQADREDDDVKILKQMGVDSYEAGFRKLWKIAGNLDLVISKITELQIIHFLQYDEMFDELGKNSQRSNGILSLIANNSYSSGTFQITQVLLDRSKDVYGAWSDLKKRGGSSLKTQEKGREDTSELISQLKTENSKLTALLEQLSSEREQEKKREQQKLKENNKVAEKKTNLTEPTLSPKDTFREIEEKYAEQIKYLTSQKLRTQEVSIELRVKISSLEAQLKAANDSGKSEKAPAPKSGSYEQALVEEMEKMKKGFERKIAVLTEQFTTRERDLRKKEADYKTENEKIKWEKSLLLKKFDLMPSK